MRALRAVRAALIGFAAMLAMGLLVAIAFPERSMIAFDGNGPLTETLAQALAFTLAAFTALDAGVSVRFTPAVFVLVPLLGTGIAAHRLSRRARDGEAPRTRVLWGAATGVPFALLMLIPALAVGEIAISKWNPRYPWIDGLGALEPSLGAVFSLSLLWGGLGGAAGALLALRPDERAELLAPRARMAAQIGWPPLRALALALAVTLIVGTAAILLQTVRYGGGSDSAPSGEGDSLLLSAVDSSLYGVEHAVHYNQLGAGAEFRVPTWGATVGLPLPIAADLTVFCMLGGCDEFSFDANQPTFRIFIYGDFLPTWAYVPLLGLIAIVALFALYGGYATARRAAAIGLPGPAAAWGALLGPVWAVAMVALNALIDKQVLAAGIFGSADGQSVLVMYLAGGTALGALGGLLAHATAASREQLPPRAGSLAHSGSPGGT